MTHKSVRLNQVKVDILTQEPCPALAGQATQLVMGEGNADADIVFVGEAPGRKEDEQGKSFVGASGKMLDELLDSIGLNRQEVYITNIVKYRPPNNRDPSAAEKQAFLPFLLQQLDIIQPSIIVTLGRHSMECFLPGAKISEVHGEIITKVLKSPCGVQREWHILPLYHPAAALYNGSLRVTLFDDMQRLSSLLRLIDPEQ